MEGVEMCFKEQSTFLFWPGYGSRVDAKTAKNIHIICLASLYFVFQKKSTRCSSTRAFDTCRGVVVPSPAIDVAAKLFEAKNSVRKPTASSNAQLSCPICGEHLRDGKETSCWKPNKMMFVLQTWKWIMAHYYSKHEITFISSKHGLGSVDITVFWQAMYHLLLLEHLIMFVSHTFELFEVFVC